MVSLNNRLRIMLKIDATKCSRCGWCEDLCYEHVIDKGPKIVKNAKERCSDCGHCVAICPREAITLDAFPDVPEKSTTKAADEATVRTLLEMRRSMRYYSAKPISAEHLNQILYVAGFGPSAKNFRALKIYVVTDESILSKLRTFVLAYYKKLLRLAALPGVFWVFKIQGYANNEIHLLRESLSTLVDPKATEDRVFHSAKTLLIFTIPKHLDISDGDAWTAAHSVTLYAQTLGIGSCYNGHLCHASKSDQKIRKAIGIPKNERFIVAMTMGYSQIKYHRPAPRHPIPIILK